MSIKDFSRLEKIVLIIISVSILGRFFILPFVSGLWWDEAVYLSLGRNLGSGIYSLDEFVLFETERPPLVPFLVYFSSESVLLSRIILSLLSVLGVIASYYLAKEAFGKKAALWASLFLACGYFFMFYTIKILSEGVFMLFLSLSALFFIRALKTNKIYFYIGSGVCAGLTVMARHFGVLILLGYTLSLIYLSVSKRQKKFLGYLLTVLLFSLITLSPWIALTSKYYSNPISAFLAKFDHVSGPYEYGLFRTASDYFFVWYVSAAFLIIGLAYILRTKIDKIKSVILLSFFLSIIFYLLLPGYKEPRYLLGFMPLATCIAGFGFVKLTEKGLKKVTASIVILLYIVSISSSFLWIWEDRIASKDLVEAGLYLKGIGQKNEIVMTLYHPYIYYLSQKRSVFLPRETDQVENVINDKGVKYILMHKNDKNYPGQGFFDTNPKFTKLAEFGQPWDTKLVVIYKVL